MESPPKTKTKRIGKIERVTFEDSIMWANSMETTNYDMKVVRG